MPHGKIRQTIPAPADEVFALLHNYDRRLEWDTLLAAASLVDGHQTAAVDAVSVCKGKPLLGGIALKTQYLVFKPGIVAAIKMINRPFPFDTFAATIRHGPIDETQSWIEYTFQFTARPRWMRFILHPIMQMLFHYETKKRLAALRSHFEREKANQPPES